MAWLHNNGDEDELARFEGEEDTDREPLPDEEGEEEIVVTETGHEIITRFPANDLMVAGHHYYTATGPMPTTHTHEPELNEQVLEMVKAVRG